MKSIETTMLIKADMVYNNFIKNVYSKIKNIFINKKTKLKSK